MSKQIKMRVTIGIATFLLFLLSGILRIQNKLDFIIFTNGLICGMWFANIGFTYVAVDIASKREAKRKERGYDDEIR